MAAFGTGDPVTLFSHGFSGAIRDTRPFASGIAGTRVLVNLGGHGGRPSPGPGWTYATIADQLAQALTGSGARRALGVSMSAGGLARLITAGHPAALGLEKVAFVLPASWAGFAPEVERAAAAHVALVREHLTAGDRAGLVDALLAREPAPVRDLPPARAWVRAKVDALFDTDMADGLGLALEIAVDSAKHAARAASAFPGEVLVLTHEDDAAHPVPVARDIAAAFPRATLEILPPGSILWRGRSEVRRILTAFFND